jgi:hypoxanthine phosphoribosyltransferase
MGYSQSSRSKVVETTNPKYEAPGWDEIYQMLLDLAQQIKKDQYKPEIIVGVSRGGWPPARVMSDLLQNPNLANMKVEFYKDIGVRNKEPRITQPVTMEVVGKRVLVVDDVSDTGRSLRVVANHLRRKPVKELRVCTVYMKPKSIFRPDYYAGTTSKWIIFPWERLEAVHLISKRFKDDRTRVSSTVRALKESGISARLVRQLLRIDDVDRRN